MTKLLCADVQCERLGVRTRDGQRYCLYHPDQVAPDMDPLTGKLRQPEKATPLRRAKKAEPAPYRAPGRVVERDVTPNVTPPAAVHEMPRQVTPEIPTEKSAKSIRPNVTPVAPEPVDEPAGPAAEVVYLEKHTPLGDPCQACGRPRGEHSAQMVIPLTRQPVVGPPAPPTPDGEVDVLVAWATQHRDRDIRDHAARLRTALSLLRTARQHEQDEAARVQREHDQAVAEIARLERELEHAKQRLLPAAAPVAVGPRPCTSCDGPVTRSHGRTGAWPRQCRTCKAVSA